MRTYNLKSVIPSDHRKESECDLPLTAQKIIRLRNMGSGLEEIIFITIIPILH
jgi:hypothetical protein